MTGRKSEYENFERTMRGLMKVPHSEVKEKLDEEKKLKDAKKKEKKAHHDR